MNLKNRLIGLMLMAVSAGAMAEWTKMSEMGGIDGHDFYIDLSTIRRSGNTAKMWTLRDFKKAKPLSDNKSYLSTVSLHEYDCNKGQERYLSLVTYSGNMKNGDIVSQWEGEEKWSESGLSKIICDATAESKPESKWTKIGGGADFDNYADLSTIRKSGNTAKIWDLRNFKKAQTASNGKSYLSFIARAEYDCNEEKYRLLSFYDYSGNMKNGDIVQQWEGEDKWSSIPPESISATELKVACGAK